MKILIKVCKGYLFVFDYDLILKFKCYNNYICDFCWMNWYLDFMNKVKLLVYIDWKLVVFFNLWNVFVFVCLNGLENYD